MTWLRLTAPILIGILFGVGMVATTYFASRADLNAIPLPGVPIESSVFAECVSEIPDPAVYPANVAILSQHPLILKYDYDGCRMINEQQAIDRAWRFIRTQLPSVEDLELWYRELSGPEPRWILLFNGSMNIHIQVNALSGKVFEYEIQGAFNHTESQSITEEQATDTALAFLNNCNYTLPEEARYLGIRSFADENGTSEGYEFRFLQYVGSAFVGNHPPSPASGGDHIEIYVDGRTAMVTRFYYFWVEIPKISLQDVVEPRVAASEVRALFVDNPEVQISNITLALCTMPSPEFPASGFVITEQLCWIISTSQPSADVYCDAFTGEYTGYSTFYWAVEPVTSLSQSKALRTTILLIIAIVVATSGYFLSRHRLDQ